ncbi:hypothetical protein MESS4_260046 [Mesorhizobium sp. STM 4661]|nr:hypothetical protein MESS4_260046 [Mesorhizobium sp. STM 4661]
MALRKSLAFELETKRLTFIINAVSEMNRRDKCLKIGKVRFLRVRVGIAWKHHSRPLRKWERFT